MALGLIFFHLRWILQVAAIFKIGNSKEIPEIPDHLSNDAKSFIRLCLQRDPSARPTASQLLDHPFVRDQATTRVANVNITKEAFPHTFDGSRTPVFLLEPCSVINAVTFCPNIPFQLLGERGRTSTRIIR